MNTTPATIDSGALAATTATAKNDPNIRALAASLILDDETAIITEYGFANIVNAKASEMGSSYPLIGSAPEAVRQLVVEYGADASAERTTLGADRVINAIAAQEVVREPRIATEGTFTSPETITALLKVLADNGVTVANPVAAAQALHDRVKVYAADL